MTSVIVSFEIRKHSNIWRDNYYKRRQLCGETAVTTCNCVWGVPGLSSDATVLTPNTESSCDLLTKTKSTSGNDDNTSLDLEWEDEEGIL